MSKSKVRSIARLTIIGFLVTAGVTIRGMVLSARGVEGWGFGLMIVGASGALAFSEGLGELARFLRRKGWAGKK